MDILSNEELSRYWNDIDATNEWLNRFRSEKNKVRLLEQVLAHVPNELGGLEYMETAHGGPFIILVTYDEESDGARENAAKIFSVFANTGAISFFATEAAWGLLQLDWIKVFPDKDILREVALSYFKSFTFAPVEFAAVTSPEPVVVWGIEDEALYKNAVDKHNSGAANYSKVLEQRVPVLFKNLLTQMQKQRHSVACASVTNYNFWEGHTLLGKRRIAHAGITATSSGKSIRYRLEPSLKGQIIDKSKEQLKEVYEAHPQLRKQDTGIDRQVSLKLSPQKKFELLLENDRRFSTDWTRRCNDLSILHLGASFDWALAFTLWGDSNDQAQRTHLALEALYNHNILKYDIATGRYSFSPKVYALVSSRQSEAASVVLDRYRAYIIFLLRQYKHLPFDKWKRLDLDKPHIYHVGDNLVENEGTILGDIRAMARPEINMPLSSYPLSEPVQSLLKVAKDFAIAVCTYISYHPETEQKGLRWLEAGLISARALKQQHSTALLLAELGKWHKDRGDLTMASEYTQCADLLHQELRYLVR